MTKSTITREQAQKIIVAADEVITALAGTNEDVHPDDSKKMCELWDDLNDRHAPPVVVRELARMALAAMDSEPVAYNQVQRDMMKDIIVRKLGGNLAGERLVMADIHAVTMALMDAGFRTAQPAPVIPTELHPDTQKLVIDFCTALAEKLYKAQLKYGYDADWKQDGWPSQCQAHFHQHIAKGDPRDVAAYCAFMWWHGWSTKPAEGLESRTVTVKLPDYRNTYKSPLADEVEHQVRLALELFSSAAGIKVEAE
ncbi:hypothetical protein [Klebsiella pasteurii]|uniref:hypothetical protein n=1 Tax=Klebsiella pasteurii TaxID=2587529 RepID=UPI00217DCB55|nr:hypothetical protein [Klebsiella pasteurii]